MAIKLLIKRRRNVFIKFGFGLIYQQGHPSGLKTGSAERGWARNFRACENHGRILAPNLSLTFGAGYKNYQYQGTGGTGQMGALVHSPVLVITTNSNTLDPWKVLPRLVLSSDQCSQRNFQDPRSVHFLSLFETVLPRLVLFLLAQKERCPRTQCTKDDKSHERSLRFYPSLTMDGFYDSDFKELTSMQYLGSRKQQILNNPHNYMYVIYAHCGISILKSSQICRLS